MEKIEAITETAAKEPVSAPKPKRAYTKNKEVPAPVPAPIQPPAPPNPTIIALEGEILQIVQQRSQANQALRNARAAMESAQIQLKNAQAFLMEMEQEVNYRMALIGQMKGEPVRQNLNIQPPVPNFDYPAYANQAQQNTAVGSYVSQQPQHDPGAFEVVQGRRVRSESAESVRAVL